MFCEKNEALIICHPIFNKREQGSKVIYALVIVVRVFNNLGLKCQSLGLEGTLEHPLFYKLCCHNKLLHPPWDNFLLCTYIPCHFLGKASSKTSTFLNIGSRTNAINSLLSRVKYINVGSTPRICWDKSMLVQIIMLEKVIHLPSVHYRLPVDVQIELRVF